MALSGTGSDATGDIFTPAGGATNAQAVSPQANFPSCYRGTAYTVWVQGHAYWTHTGVNTKAYVSYLWCPRWAGDSVGLNVAYGRAYVLDVPVNSCEWIGMGRIDTGAQLGGAMISTGSLPGGPKMAFDGESAVFYNICPGQYAWDYSLTVPGTGTYGVGMDAFDDSRGTHAVVWSPVG
jgi:hypothetical protein